jgi:hypothetical protein
MEKLPVIIEFCGIPYSRKTTTIHKLAKILRQNSVEFEIVDEFRGDSNFYSSAKYTPDLNLVRSFKCLESIITCIHHCHCDTVLIDRGIFDTYCWLSWFETKKKVPKELFDLVVSMLHTIEYYSLKYRIVWFDIDPLLSVSNHGHQGSIINIRTITELRAQYSLARENLGQEFMISRVESGEVSSSVLAERLYEKYKF